MSALAASSPRLAGPSTHTRRVAAAASTPAGRALAPTRAPPARLAGGSRLAPSLQRDVTRAGLFGLGLPELAVIAGVAALIFGPSKLPSIGKELGKTVKSFQTAAKEFETELKSAATEEEEAEKKKESE